MSKESKQKVLDEFLEKAKAEDIDEIVVFGINSTDREINPRNYGTIKMEPETDGEIWKTYHDCNMYGLPEYARPYCEGKVQES